MKGTEKQIAFAQNLVEKFDKEMNDLIDICPEQFKNDWITRKEKIDVIFSEAYAGDVIDILKGNNETGKDYYTRFFTVTKLNGDALARKIMAEVYGR